MATNPNERLAELLDEADAALDEALPLFRRIDECNAFGIGGMPGSKARKDPDVVAIRDRIESFVGPLAEQLIRAKDRHGRALDFAGPIRDTEGNLQAIGARGERLCALWLEFRSALGVHDALGCIEAALGMRSFVSAVRHDVGAAPARLVADGGAAADKTAAALAESPPTEPRAREGDARNSIAKNGSHWLVAYEGTKGTYPDLRGFRILAELLMNPDKGLGCLDLVGRVREGNLAPERGDKRSAQAIEAALGAAEARGDGAEAAELREELQRARRGVEAPDVGKARRAVGKAIGVALGHIQRGQPKLAGDLRRDIMTPYGTVVSYRPPEGGRAWAVDVGQPQRRRHR